MNTIFENRPKSDKEINIILVKRDVAIECAASVTGFIFRNYDLKHIPYPKDIKEIYERNTYYEQNAFMCDSEKELDYEQNAFMCDSEKELDRILEQIKADEEYVRQHTPKPHR